MNKKSTYFPAQAFNYSFLIFWILSILIIAFSSRGEVELWVNSLSYPALDIFFLIVTTLGSGWFAIGLFFFFLFVDYRQALCILLTLFFVALFSNLFKRVIFFQHYRPLWDFFYADLHRLISGLPIRYKYSFPSGHTMTVFATASLLSLFYNKKWIVFSLFGISLLVGFSRIYLLQHYLIDVLWGAILGYFASFLSISICRGFILGRITTVTDKSLLVTLKKTGYKVEIGRKGFLKK